VAVAEVHGQVDATAGQLGLDIRDDLLVLVIDGGAPAQGVIVLPDLLQPLAGDAPAAGHVLQEWDHILRLLGPAEGKEQQSRPDSRCGSESRIRSAHTYDCSALAGFFPNSCRSASANSGVRNSCPISASTTGRTFWSASASSAAPSSPSSSRGPAAGTGTCNVPRRL